MIRGSVILYSETLAAMPTVNRGVKSFRVIELVASAQRGIWRHG